MAIASFKAAKLTILQSLKAGERATGAELAHELRMHSIGKDLPPIELRHCQTKSDFCLALDRIESEAAAGEIPIVHIECHGNSDSGIYFADDDNMGWDELAASLTKLNRQTNFNLLLGVSACFGAYFQKYMPPVRASPCWGIVAPTNTANPIELQEGFLAFYKALFDELDLTEAMRLLRSMPLSIGDWHVGVAEWWFQMAVKSYFERHCLAVNVESRVEQMLAQRASESLPWVSKRDATRFLKLQNQQAIEKYFKIYFDTESTPSNFERFASVKTSLEEEVARMIASGNYHL